MRGVKRGYLLLVSAIAMLLIGGSMAGAQQTRERDFSLQVTPSPIVQTLKPGEQKNVDLRIRNNGSQPEQLKAELRSFIFDDATGDIRLTDDVPGEVKDWVSFAYPVFNITPGATFTQQLRMNTPADAGFSYAFAVTLQRTVPTVPTGGKPAIEGSVAVFTLLSIDKPGAERKFNILQFSSKKRIYEYLPAEFEIQIKNTGNTLTQPAGNVFIQRSSASSEPVSVLALNSAGSYILPGMSRTLRTSWEEGFPVYKLKQEATNTNPERYLSWEWGNAEKFRIGRYVAKVVAVYNDGQRDIPVFAEVAFWVFPWKLFLGLLLLVSIGIAGIISIIRVLRRARIHRLKKSKTTEQDDE